MIPNIVEGGNTIGLMQYLVGPGRANEHTEPHIVAGDAPIMATWGDWSELSAAQATEIARALDLNMTLKGTRPEGNVRGYNEDQQRSEVIGRGPNHVWHCSLSLSPEEGPLSEEKWERIANDFMDEMGFTEASGKAPCAWVAIHHGGSKNGGDHVHIVANIVREDGTKWSSWQDQRRSQAACNKLEHRYGLQVLESREHNRSARHDSAQEQNLAARQGKPVTDRAALETRVRAAATAASTEVDFVRRVRQLGVRIRPRFASGRTDVVSGYSVALHTEPGQQPQWYGGGRLGRDLTLARLRTRWESTPHGAQAAVDEWRSAWKGDRLRSRSRTFTSDEIANHARALDDVGARLAGINPYDATALADATHDVAGLLSAAAIRHAGTRNARIFDKTARYLARHAQTKSRILSPTLRPSPITMAAGLLMTATLPSGRSQDMLLILSALRLAQTLAELHRQARQTNTARTIERDTIALWSVVHPHVPASLPQSAYEAVAAAPAPMQTDTLPPVAPATESPPIEEAWVDGVRSVLLANAGVRSTPTPAPRADNPTLLGEDELERLRDRYDKLGVHNKLPPKNSQQRPYTPRPPQPRKSDGPRL